MNLDNYKKLEPKPNETPKNQQLANSDLNADYVATLIAEKYRIKHSLIFL
jgi:hypothetical protein